MSDPVPTDDPSDFGEEEGDTLDSSSETSLADQSVDSSETAANEGAYWRENIRLLCSLMVVWFAASFGCGILLRDWLDQFMLGGYPLGFWFAQQGAIYTFIVLIAFYVVRMKQIERKYDLDD
jgi:putative solute:sodium symporter small subunit